MKSILILTLLSGSLSLTAQVKSDESNTSIKNFEGPYLGVSIGAQNMFGGANINGLDFLAQKSALVVEFAAGYRKQFAKDRLLIGLELQLGITDGDLVQTYIPLQLDVIYTNSSQGGYGLIGGVTLGTKKRALLYTYGKITKRNFDITLNETNGTRHTQEDGQRFLQYGIGTEVTLSRKMNVRASVGGIDVDFGDMETSQNVKDKMDLNIGIVYRL